MAGSECCTVFNRRLVGEERREVFTPTLLEGVYWQGGGAMRDRKQPSDGNIEVYIPCSIPAARRYLPPRAYAAQPDGHWTLREGDLLCRGARDTARCACARALLEEEEAVSIMSISENRFGSEGLQHWEVCAR